jgi:hypothetical protein
MTAFYIIMFVVPLSIIVLAVVLSNRIKARDNG